MEDHTTYNSEDLPPPQYTTTTAQGTDADPRGSTCSAGVHMHLQISTSEGICGFNPACNSAACSPLCYGIEFEEADLMSQDAINAKVKTFCPRDTKLYEHKDPRKVSKTKILSSIQCKMALDPRDADPIVKSILHYFPTQYVAFLSEFVSQCFGSGMRTFLTKRIDGLQKLIDTPTAINTISWATYKAVSDVYKAPGYNGGLVEISDESIEWTPDLASFFTSSNAHPNVYTSPMSCKQVYDVIPCLKQHIGTLRRLRELCKGFATREVDVLLMLWFCNDQGRNHCQDLGLLKFNQLPDYNEIICLVPQIGLDGKVLNNQAMSIPANSQRLQVSSVPCGDWCGVRNTNDAIINLVQASDFKWSWGATATDEKIKFNEDNTFTESFVYIDNDATFNHDSKHNPKLHESLDPDFRAGENRPSAKDLLPPAVGKQEGVYRYDPILAQGRPTGSHPNTFSFLSRMPNQDADVRHILVGLKGNKLQQVPVKDPNNIHYAKLTSDSKLAVHHCFLDFVLKYWCRMFLGASQLDDVPKDTELVQATTTMTALRKYSVEGNKAIDEDGFCRLDFLRHFDKHDLTTGKCPKVFDLVCNHLIQNIFGYGVGFTFADEHPILSEISTSNTKRYGLAKDVQFADEIKDTAKRNKENLLQHLCQKNPLDRVQKTISFFRTLLDVSVTTELLGKIAQKFVSQWLPAWKGFDGKDRAERLSLLFESPIKAADSLAEAKEKVKYELRKAITSSDLEEEMFIHYATEVITPLYYGAHTTSYDDKIARNVLEKSSTVIALFSEMLQVPVFDPVFGKHPVVGKDPVFGTDANVVGQRELSKVLEFLEEFQNKAIPLLVDNVTTAGKYYKLREKATELVDQGEEPDPAIRAMAELLYEIQTYLTPMISRLKAFKEAVKSLVPAENEKLNEIIEEFEKSEKFILGVLKNDQEQTGPVLSRSYKISDSPFTVPLYRIGSQLVNPVLQAFKELQELLTRYNERVKTDLELAVDSSTVQGKSGAKANLFHILDRCALIWNVRKFRTPVNEPLSFPENIPKTESQKKPPTLSDMHYWVRTLVESFAYARSLQTQKEGDEWKTQVRVNPSTHFPTNYIGGVMKDSFQTFFPLLPPTHELRNRVREIRAMNCLWGELHSGRKADVGPGAWMPLSFAAQMALYKEVGLYSEDERVPYSPWTSEGGGMSHIYNQSYHNAYTVSGYKDPRYDDFVNNRLPYLTDKYRKDMPDQNLVREFSQYGGTPVTADFVYYPLDKDKLNSVDTKMKFPSLECPTSTAHYDDQSYLSHMFATEYKPNAKVSEERKKLTVKTVHPTSFLAYARTHAILALSSCNYGTEDIHPEKAVAALFRMMVDMHMCTNTTDSVPMVLGFMPTPQLRPTDRPVTVVAAPLDCVTALINDFCDKGGNQKERVCPAPRVAALNSAASLIQTKVRIMRTRQKKRDNFLQIRAARPFGYTYEQYCTEYSTLQDEYIHFLHSTLMSLAIEAGVSPEVFQSMQAQMLEVGKFAPRGFDSELEALFTRRLNAGAKGLSSQQLIAMQFFPANRRVLATLTHKEAPTVQDLKKFKQLVTQNAVDHNKNVINNYVEDMINAQMAMNVMAQTGEFDEQLILSLPPSEQLDYVDPLKDSSKLPDEITAKTLPEPLSASLGGKQSAEMFAMERSRLNEAVRAVKKHVDTKFVELQREMPGVTREQILSRMKSVSPQVKNMVARLLALDA